MQLHRQMATLLMNICCLSCQLSVFCALSYKVNLTGVVCIWHTLDNHHDVLQISTSFSICTTRAVEVCHPSRCVCVSFFSIFIFHQIWHFLFLFCSCTNSRYIVSLSVRTHLSAAAANAVSLQWSGRWKLKRHLSQTGFCFHLLASCSLLHLPTTATFCPAWAGKVLILLRVDYVWICVIRNLISVSLRQALRN